MSGYKQSFSYWCFKDLTDAKAIQIREVGIRGVELLPRDQFDRWRDLGFTITSHAGHASLEDGLNKKSNKNRIVDELGANLELAKQYQIPKLIVFSGNRAGQSDEAGAEIVSEALRQIAGQAEAAGVTLVMELLNSKVDHVDYQCDHTAWGVQVIEAVASPRVKLLYDIYHMQIMEGDLIRTIRDNIAHIGHFHTAGVPGRHELDLQQEIHHPAVARAIQETGYTGWVGHEFVPRGDAVAGLKQAFDQFNL